MALKQPLHPPGGRPILLLFDIQLGEVTWLREEVIMTVWERTRPGRCWRNKIVHDGTFDCSDSSGDQITCYRDLFKICLGWGDSFSVCEYPLEI